MKTKNKYFGYTNKYIRVNLTTGNIKVLPTPVEWQENYLGGSGFGTKILYDEVSAEIDPLSEKNKLIIATGPLSGTLWPSSGRIAVISKSPLTNIYGDANSGGFFAPELKFAGYDFIVVEGKSNHPVYLYIEQNSIKLLNAEHIWGKTTFETEEIIRKTHNDDEIKVLCIGPAGENLVRYACIMVSYGRTASRSGMGAVMGSKMLKAIAVRGYGKVEVAHPQKFFDTAVKAQKLILDNEFTEGESKYGTPALVELMNEVGRFPTRNYQQGHCDYVDQIGSQRLQKEFVVSHLACYCCPIGCDKYYFVKKGEFAGVDTVSLEYETISALGSRCDNRNLESIIKMDRICNELGLDTISTGGVIAFLMELNEKKLISARQFDNLDLSWGNYDTMIKLIEKIAYRQGCGDMLAEGVYRLSKMLGPETEYYAMHVKGQEIPAQDGRAQQSMGLAHVTSSRGADHLKGFPTIDETGYPGEAIKRYGKDKLPEIVDGTQPKYKPMVVKDGEDFCAVLDSAVVCKFGTMFPPALYWEEITEGIKYATGMDIDVHKLKKIGERIYNLQRVYNIMCGISKKDDKLPERFIKEKSPSKRAKGHIVYLDKMLPEYYRIRNWDEKTGYPKREKLVELGLTDAVKKIYSK
ncbi:MAG: aldehyde ferredoxin oxidoreductase family protein [Elusimicrobiota bacterium]|nr:aldehyde ferredoxin oxidoreductase family protein [Elusimicrobiota bacterium]